MPESVNFIFLFSNMPMSRFRLVESYRLAVRRGCFIAFRWFFGNISNLEFVWPSGREPRCCV